MERLSYGKLVESEIVEKREAKQLLRRICQPNYRIVKIINTMRLTI
jgi:hypothetical protein